MDRIAPDLASLACEMENEVFVGTVDTVHVLALKHDDTSLDGEILRREFCMSGRDVQKKVATPAPATQPVAPPATATPTREPPSDMHLDISKKYFDSGTEYFLNGEYEIAIQEFGKAIDIYPGYIQAYGARGLTYSYMGQYRQAISDFDKLIELEPNNAEG